MNGFSQFKKKIRHRAEILDETIRELSDSGPAEEPAAEKWRTCLDGVLSSLQDPLLKIAVVGSVKSGKSTLINSMIGEDLLKRGAGIITAFITRVVTDKDAGGWVELKSWPQISAEMNASLHMLPVVSEREKEGSLDLRNREDRERIAYWLEKMKSEWLQSHGTIDPHFMFLDRCIQGFSLVEKELGDEVSRIEFGKGQISRHQLYAGEESRSVYVRDIEIHHPIPWLGDRIELADCQGSDSPNPAHFELLQQYLLSSHFVVYVIGSRTGLREADFKLLQLIKSMRMFPQTLFVLNLDLDVHGDSNDIEQITERVRSELGWMVPEPRLFSFSALFQLLKGLGEKAPKFERRRFKMWKEGKSLPKTSDSGWSAFRKELEDRICLHRAEVLLGCGLSRLGMIAANIRDTAHVRRSALEMDIDGMKERAEKLRSRHLALQSTLRNLSETVSGLNGTIKREADSRFLGYFDYESGSIVREALNLVEFYPIDLDGRKGIADYARLIREYYAFYLEFRRSLSRHLIDKVNLRIVEFAKDEECRLKDRISDASEALWAFFDAALADYRLELLGTQPDAAEKTPRAPLDPNQGGRIVPPSFSSFLERNGLGRGILFLKFGLTSLPNVLSGIRAQMRKKAGSTDEKVVENLFGKAQKMAREEAKSELLRAFGDFGASLKSGFLYRIVDEGCIALLEEFRMRAEMAHVDFSNLLKQHSLNGDERTSAIEVLTRTAQITSAMIEELEELRRNVRTTEDAPDPGANTLKG